MSPEHSHSDRVRMGPAAAVPNHAHVRESSLEVQPLREMEPSRHAKATVDLSTLTLTQAKQVMLRCCAIACLPRLAAHTLCTFHPVSKRAFRCALD
jgi:hypothetical protein